MKNWTDNQLQTIDKLIQYVIDEHAHQIGKWGIQNHHAVEWMCFLTEEVGELAKAIAEAEYSDGTKIEIVKEAIQVATLALKIAEMAGKN